MKSEKSKKYRKNLRANVRLLAAVSMSLGGSFAGKAMDSFSASKQLPTQEMPSALKAFVNIASRSYGEDAKLTLTKTLSLLTPDSKKALADYFDAGTQDGRNAKYDEVADDIIFNNGAELKKKYALVPETSSVLHYNATEHTNEAQQGSNLSDSQSLEALGSLIETLLSLPLQTQAHQDLLAFLMNDGNKESKEALARMQHANKPIDAILAQWKKIPKGNGNPEEHAGISYLYDTQELIGSAMQAGYADFISLWEQASPKIKNNAISMLYTKTPIQTIIQFVREEVGKTKKKQDDLMPAHQQVNRSKEEVRTGSLAMQILDERFSGGLDLEKALQDANLPYTYTELVQHMSSAAEGELALLQAAVQEFLNARQGNLSQEEAEEYTQTLIALLHSFDAPVAESNASIPTKEEPAEKTALSSPHDHSARMRERLSLLQNGNNPALKNFILERLEKVMNATVKQEIDALVSEKKLHQAVLRTLQMLEPEIYKSIVSAYAMGIVLALMNKTTA